MKAYLVRPKKKKNAIWVVGLFVVAQTSVDVALSGDPQTAQSPPGNRGVTEGDHSFLQGPRKVTRESRGCSGKNFTLKRKS